MSGSRRALRPVALLALGTLFTIGATFAPTPSAAWDYIAHVQGIPLTDVDGRTVHAPFLGGFDVPRPQLMDMNGDGVPELFVQERTGEVMMFERAAGEWQWRSDRFQNLDVGEWYRFVRSVPDGTMLLFGEMPTGYIRVWRNEGSASAPRFVALGDTVRDVDGRALVADRQNILTAVDIDCNGKLDLFIGRVQGVVDRYEQEGTSPGGSPRFRLVEESWQGIEVLGPEAGGGIKPDTGGEAQTHRGPFVAPVPEKANRFHGANTLAFADVSGRNNGVLDLFWGDFFEQGLLRFENTGSCAQPDFTTKPVRFPPTQPLLTSGYNAPAFGDVNGDGTVDLILGVIGGAFGPSRTSIENLYYSEQSPRDSWNVKSKRAVPTIDVGSDAAPTLADITGDGLADLIVGNRVSTFDIKTGTVTWFENVGTALAPAFRERGLLGVKGSFSYAPTVRDLDGDSLPDLVLGTWNDRIQWYRNTGTRSAPAFTLADTALVTIPRGSNTVPTLGDLDGDGLADMLIGKAAGQILFYKNVGTKTAPKFSLVTDHLQDIRVGRRSAPLLVDMTGSGKLDLLIGSDDGHIELWRNTGNATTREVRFERDISFAVQSYRGAIPAAADLRRTGTPDLFVGTSSGGLRWFSRP